MAGATQEAQSRRPPGGRPFRRADAGGRGEALAEDGCPELGARRLAERVVLRHRQERRDLRQSDIGEHALNRRWGVLPMR